MTNTGTGMAVPDWPTTFGYNMFLYPWSQMVGGILYEHAHRLLGSLVGALTLTLAIFLWALEPRKWVRGLGSPALGAVVVQGVLGGLRVVLAQDGLAIVHGGFAHAFLRSHREFDPGHLAELARGCRVYRVARSTSAAPAGMLHCCRPLLAGASRHPGDPFGHAAGRAHFRRGAHLGGGDSARLLDPTRRADWPELARPAGDVLRVLWIVQLLLGLGAYLAKFRPGSIALGPGLSLALSVSHRLTGGLMLITSLVVALRIYRRTGWPEPRLDHESLSRKVSA